MIIPTFKTKTVPVYEMEQYLNASTEEAKTFKRILIAIKDYKLYLNAKQLASILEYEEKAELEVFSILVNMGRFPNTNYDYYSLKEEFESIKEFVTYKEKPVEELKYYAVKQLIEELDLIHEILIEVNNLNYMSESVVVANIHDLQKNLKE